ncbi:VanZ like family protein [Ruminococcaceae bacterium KH2T8]|nr:VanZ like family protein [Ruminococcaceae bacterium KH2T8]
MPSPGLNTELSRKDISIYYLISCVLLWLMTTLWMIEIFHLSAESGHESHIRSASILLAAQAKIGYIPFDDTVIRKLAHVFEFSVLSILVFFAIRNTNKVSKKVSYSESTIKIIKSDNEVYILISLWVSTLYAILDEYHQLFVQERSGSIKDVLIDIIGIVPTLLIIRLIFTLYLKRLGKNETRYEEDDN